MRCPWALLVAALRTTAALPLPPALLALNSTEGRRLLADPTALTSSYEQSIIHFVSQADQGSCFRASATIVLNALGAQGLQAPVDKPYQPYAYWTQDTVVSSDCARSNCTHFSLCRGATLGMAASALACTDAVEASALHARDKLRSATDLSALLRRTLSSGEHVIANFVGKPMGIEHGGHYSPCVAYHPGRDMVLVLDVSRYKYPPWWVSVSTLWAGLDTVDFTAMQRRGVITVRLSGSPSSGAVSV